MKTSEAFGAAKLHLANGYQQFSNECKPSFICFALDRAFRPNGESSSPVLRRCRNIIHARLRGAATLEDWLNNQGINPEDPRLKFTEQITKMQVTRHAWLDSLIAEYQAKGD